MSDVLLVRCTFPDSGQARQIGTALVERQLAACVNILPPVTSIYRWEGETQQATEWLLFIKTSSPQFENLKLELARIHPYEVPELIAVPILDGAAPYLAWMEESLDKGDGA